MKANNIAADIPNIQIDQKLIHDYSYEAYKNNKDFMQAENGVHLRDFMRTSK